MQSFSKEIFCLASCREFPVLKFPLLKMVTSFVRGARTALTAAILSGQYVFCNQSLLVIFAQTTVRFEGVYPADGNCATTLCRRYGLKPPAKNTALYQSFMLSLIHQHLWFVFGLRLYRDVQLKLLICMLVR